MNDQELLRAAQGEKSAAVFAARIGRNRRLIFAWKAKGPALKLPDATRAQLTRMVGAKARHVRPLGAAPLEANTPTPSED